MLGVVGSKVWRFHTWPIFGDPGAVSRIGRKGETKVYKYRRKSSWVPTLTELFLKIQADAVSWLGTKNAFYYCAQSANSFSWVVFVSLYTTAMISIRACLAHAPKKCTQSEDFQFDIKSPSDFCPKTKDAFPKNTSLSLQRAFTLASVRSCVNIRELLKDTTTADSHENVAWRSEFTFISLHSDYSNSLTLSNASELFWSWISINHIQVHEENEFCRCLFTSFTKREIRHFHG